MDENPYVAPVGGCSKHRPSAARAVLVVVGCTIACAAIGTSAGYLLGSFAPGYYRSVFRNGDAPGFDPVEVGIGLGLTQGLALGFIAGVIIVVVLMRQRRRSPA
ncbi:MAG TPA: hypothetical protein VHC22_31820 [Pirellulales bacterium]|nr:hypothetical protein [Pirellulales bacterium]